LVTSSWHVRVAAWHHHTITNSRTNRRGSASQRARIAWRRGNPCCCCRLIDAAHPRTGHEHMRHTRRAAQPCTSHGAYVALCSCTWWCAAMPPHAVTRALVRQHWRGHAWTPPRRCHATVAKSLPTYRLPSSLLPHRREAAALRRRYVEYWTSMPPCRTSPSLPKPHTATSSMPQQPFVARLTLLT
jgi:hypothetical protein